jgi:putative component of toxin-antitoxin plasmid stabilization module
VIRRAIWRVLIASFRHESMRRLVRFAATPHGDVKSLKGRPGELRLRVGKWRIFFCLEPPVLIRVLGIDNRGEAY